jgi:NADP-dependent 3-hydroxy acid dehydrogenase YdfG
VLTAAAQVKQRCPDGIDVLCCNAGVMALPDSIVTADG